MIYIKTVHYLVGSLVVKALRYSSMCPGVDSASKNEYQDNPGGKGGRCVKLTTYHLHVPIVKKYRGLNLLEPSGFVQACNGTLSSLSSFNNAFSVEHIMRKLMQCRTV